MSLSLEKCTLRFTVKRLLSADNTNTYIGCELVSQRVICCLLIIQLVNKANARAGACERVTAWQTTDKEAAPAGLHSYTKVL